MSTLNAPTKISKRHEMRQDTVVTFYARAWEYVDRNRTLAIGVLAGLVLLAVGIVGYFLYQGVQGEKAQGLLAQALAVYDEGNYRLALDGDENTIGLLEVADEYGGSDAGNLAHFYAGDALYRLGEYDEALDHFEDFDIESNVVGAGAYAAMAAIYENKEEYERAGDLYRRAASVFPNELTSPQYLLQAGRAYETAGEYDDARDAYESIREDYPESELISGLDFYLARIDAKEKATS